MNRHEFTMIIRYDGVLPPAHMIASRRPVITDPDPRTMRDATGNGGVPRVRSGHFVSAGSASSVKICGGGSAY